MMRTEFDAMEDYWENKLQVLSKPLDWLLIIVHNTNNRLRLSLKEERSFYAEQLIINDDQLTELELRIQDYQLLTNSRSAMVSTNYQTRKKD